MCKIKFSENRRQKDILNLPLSKMDQPYREIRVKV